MKTKGAQSFSSSSTSSNQLKLFKRLTPKLTHGGGPTTGKRKARRPIVSKLPLHVILRATQACGKWSLLHPSNSKHVDQILRNTAKRHEVTLMQQANVGNHLHLLLKGKTREGLVRFLREATGAIAMTVTGARKSYPLKNRFWDHLAFSRVVPWGRALQTARDYLTKNVFEAAGLLSAKDKAEVRIITVECGEAPA